MRFFSHLRRTLSPLDYVIIVLLAAAGLFLVYRIQQQLHYNWQWRAMPQYLLHYDPSQKKWVFGIILHGFATTIRLSIWACLLALVLGTVAGLMQVGRNVFNKWMARAYVELIRNMPPLVLIFVFYYFISDQLLPGLAVEDTVRSLSPHLQNLLALTMAPPELLAAFLSALITLALFEGAYIAEIVRAGIQSIDRGQREASAALGLSRWQAMRHVIGPQAVQRILPPLAGQFISTIKDSAIVSVISIQELTFQGMALMSTTYLTFEIWIIITGLYLLLTLPCSVVVQRLETRLRNKGTHAGIHSKSNPVRV